MLRLWGRMAMMEGAIGHGGRYGRSAQVLEPRLGKSVRGVVSHHAWRGRRVGFTTGRHGFIVVVVIVARARAFLARKVLGALVFVWSAILQKY
jgi:hypothetical protein